MVILRIDMHVASLSSIISSLSAYCDFSQGRVSRVGVSAMKDRRGRVRAAHNGT